MILILIYELNSLLTIYTISIKSQQSSSLKIAHRAQHRHCIDRLDVLVGEVLDVLWDMHLEKVILVNHSNLKSYESYGFSETMLVQKSRFDFFGWSIKS